MKLIAIAIGVIMLLSPVQIIKAQSDIPIIKATSASVSIRVGDTLFKHTWIISPEIRPDIYWTSSRNKKITFYTDIDSISFFVRPDSTYNFVILLNGKDSALTQIRYVDLVKMALPIPLIYNWSPSNPHEDSLPVLPHRIGEVGRKSIHSIQPFLVQIDTASGVVKDTLWKGKETLIDASRYIEIPRTWINEKNGVVLYYNLTYARLKKSPHVGQGGWETVMLAPEAIHPDKQPFPYSVESTPKNAELFFIDKQTWDFHETQLNKVFKEIEKTYDLGRIQDQSLILSLLSDYINPTGYPTPTEIYIYDTPYILFVRLKNKIRVTKIEPNRSVPGLNRKLVNL